MQFKDIHTHEEITRYLSPFSVIPFTVSTVGSRSVNVGFCFVNASATFSRLPCPTSRPSNFCIADSASPTVL